MAQKLANYIMTHSFKVSIMPNVWKNQNYASDEDVVKRDLERQAIFGVAGSPIPLLIY